MSQFIIIYLSCVLAMVCQIQCATKILCSNERAELRNEVVMSYGDLVSEQFILLGKWLIIIACMYHSFLSFIGNQPSSCCASTTFRRQND